MATARKWTNVAVAMQSALATALTISGITKANPGVVSYTGTDPSNGDYVYLSVQGMHQVNDRVFRVANVNGAANTFELEGEDTTAFDTFSSGTAQVITFGTSITTSTKVTPSGGGFDFIDTTTIHGNQRSQMPGLPNARSYAFTNIWDVSDTGLKAMKSASDGQAMRAFKFTFGTGGQIMVFTGYPAADLSPGGEALGLVTCDTVITVQGSPTYYAS
ncbi:MAG: phage tail tube protein [Anaerolineae bacterium]